MVDKARPNVSERNDVDLDHEEEVKDTDYLQGAGIIFPSGHLVMELTIDPTENPGVDAPLYSRGFRDNGDEYKKTSSASTGWELVGDTDTIFGGNASSLYTGSPIEGGNASSIY